MAVSKRLRYEILRRDNHTCRYCHATDAPLQIDHVVAVTLGGTDDPSNLVAACKDCNGGKSSAATDGSLISDVAQDALRWARAVALASEQAQANRTVRYDASAAVYEAWGCEMSQYAYMPNDWERSINSFTGAGLTLADLLEAVNIAATKYGITNGDRWRYFCGVCNGMIRQRHEAARALLDAEQPPPTKRIDADIAYAPATYTYLSRVCDGPALDAFDARMETT